MLMVGRPLLYLVLLVLGLPMMSTYMVRTVLPYVATGASVESAWVARLLYMSFLVLALLSPVAGYLCDRLGVRRVVVVSSVAAAVSVAAYAWASSLQHLVVVRLAHSLANTFLIASSLALAAYASASGGYGFSALRFSQGLCIAVGPLIAGLVAERAGVVLALALASLLALLPAAAVLGVGGEASQRKPGPRAVVKAVARVASDRRVLAAAAPAVAQAVGFSVLATYYVTYLVTVRGWKPTSLGAFMMIESLGFSLGSLASEKLYTAAGPRILAPLALGLAVAYTGLAYTATPHLVQALALAVGVASGLVYNPAYREAARLAPPEARGTIVNALDMVTDVSMAVALLALDPLAVSLGLQATVQVVALLLAASAAPAALLSREPSQ